MKQEIMWWQWHQVDHMQICILLFLMPNQRSKQWRQKYTHATCHKSVTRNK